MRVIEELKGMSEQRFLDIYQALEDQGFGPLDGEVAKALHFRPHAIKKLPMAQRARRARLILERSANAELAYEIFGAYLMKRSKELVTRFLDAVGVAHEEGLIESIHDAEPDVAKIAPTVTELDRDFDPADVTLYLSICAEQWPALPAIQSAWQSRR